MAPIAIVGAGPTVVQSLREFATSVQLSVKTNRGIEIVASPLVVGCDGMHSVIREQAQIPFEGSMYAEDFVLADVDMEWPYEPVGVDLFFSNFGLVVVAPLPHNRYRIVATMKGAPSDHPLAVFEQILRERGPLTVPKITRIWWSSRFRVHHRVAATFRKGRVLLAGDAAHVHSPAGGQGMNTGIQDAITLAHALSECLGSGKDCVLDEWAAKRTSIAKDVVSLTDRATRVATLSSSSLKVLRNAIISTFGRLPLVQHAIAERLAEITYR